MTPDLLDELLDRSAPATRAEDPSDLRYMVSAARREVLPARRTPRIAVGLGVFALVVGGAGVAVANDLLWSDWVQDPTGTYSFTLPSGATCTAQTGDVESADPRVTAIVAEFYRGDVMSAIDVDAAIAELRADPPIAYLEDGTRERIEPGSPHYDEDTEYKSAVSIAVGEALVDYLRENGYPAGEHTARGEVLCSNDESAGDR